MPAATPIVQLVDVDKEYDEAGRSHPVLRDVRLEIAEGQVVAILGRSGSGKTTVLNLIAGIDVPNRGEVRVAGTPVTSLPERERTLFRRSNIGFVYQFFNLIPTLTVVENVQLPLELQGRLHQCRSCAMTLLEQVGLADRCASFPDRLSGGEQQRVAVARALVARPRVVLADEPTGNLDADIGEQILDLLIGLTRDEGRTLVMATHSRRVAARADRVVRMESARLVEVGLADLAPDPSRVAT